MLKTKRYHLVGIPIETAQMIEKQLNSDEKTIGKWVNNRILVMLKLKRNIIYDEFQTKIMEVE